MRDRSKPDKSLDAGRVPDTYEDLAQASKEGSIFGRVNQAFHGVLQNSRGSGRNRAPAEEAGEDPLVTADDLAIRRAKNVKPQRMIIPEGVIINGSMTSGSETEISGRIEGDVNVDGRLYLGASALVTGNVRAASCRVEGLVEGKMECSQDLELGRTGRLNAAVLVGKRMMLAGQVFGDISTGGSVQLVASARVTGDIRARKILIEEGAIFNGRCTMRPPAQRGQGE
ncbi:MAG: polymer-forming cytoskeletal protein [Candidatus Hydrogenedentes bacterium]|nr:polymer-forming cytoskeletal protein [Candidatus Hydrogenedentota bacterium]